MTTSRALTLFLALALLGFVFLALSTPAARAADPVVVRVKVGGATSGTCGGTWETACELQYALTTVAITGTELWVAGGTYTPTQSTDRTATFQLHDGIALYGGFGGNETLRSQRNFGANVTILSGDIGVPGDSNDNSYHVVAVNTITNTAVLDGFTVTGGRADGLAYPQDVGGGMYNNSISLMVSNVTFSGNSASSFAGGMYNFGSATLTNVTFIGNSARGGGGMNVSYGGNISLFNVTFFSNTARETGGGLFNSGGNLALFNVTFSSNSATEYNGGGIYNDSSNPTLTNVTFINNTSGYNGGAMENEYSFPTLTNVTFTGNKSGNDGGGMYNNSGSNALLTNVTFSSNSARQFGGGMYNNSSDPTLTNITFIGNSAQNDSGGGMFNNWSNPKLTNVTFNGNWASIAGGGMYNETSNPLVRNTIFWGNAAPNSTQVFDNNSTPSVSYSVVQGGYPSGTHIVTADPWLGPLGNWGGSTRTIPLLPGSSAIDAGDDATCAPTDQRGIPRPVGLHCDVGAFEYLPYRVGLPFIGK